MLRVNLLFEIVLTFVLLVGGAIQFAGLLSNTIATTLVTIVFLFLGITGNSINNIKINPFPYIFLIFIILVSAFANSSKSILIALYVFSFAISPYSIYKFISTRIIDKIDLKRVFKFFIIIGLIQLPVLLLQQTFASEMVSLSNRPLALEDVAFGTFFFANDHGLGFFVLCLILYLLYDDSGKIVQRRWLLVFWFSLTIVVANSNISFLLLMIIFGAYVLPRLRQKTFFLGMVVAIFIGSVILILPSISDVIVSKYAFIERKLFAQDNSWEEAQRKIERGQPERSDILVYYGRQDFKYWGDGPFSYFDPLLGKFVLFKNFSQYLWFYNDLGIFGLFSIFLIYISFYLSNCRIRSYKLFILMLILVYAFFANTLSDLSMNIIFALYILKDSKQRYKNIKYEYSLHSLPRLA